MALAERTRIGRYEIGALIGAGGMGEVYRARDTQLNRDVALKILPEGFAHDQDRVARFEREAKTLASLNHPNIASIYGLEATKSTRALAMELVPGPTLDEAIRRHVERGTSAPHRIEWALPIARQIADALESAHEQGIVHRDLKPPNVKVRDDGTVKLLDFGLAKAFSPDAPVPDGGAGDATRTSPALTAHGVILGTVAYMAPEQAKGQTVDRRADIWAFGVVLYEMLTGRRLFDAPTVGETLAAVLRQDIGLGALPAETPAVVRTLLVRCLDRDPRTRLRDIGEARITLGQPLSRSGPPAPSRTLGWFGRIAWLVCGLVAGAAIWSVARGLLAGESVNPFQNVVLTQLTNLPGPEMHADISPDGRQVIYTSEASGNRDIYLLRIGGTHAINLTAGSADQDEQGRFSPSGELIAFRSSRDGGGLFVMGATGESRRRLTTAGFDPDWSPDGRFLVYSTAGVSDPYLRGISSELWKVEIATHKTTSLLTGGDAVQPAWSPDGRRIAFWANKGGQRDIWTMAADGGEPVAVTMDEATDWSPEWAPDGRHLLFVSDRSGSVNLWRVRLSTSTGRVEGPPEPLTNSLRSLASVRLSSDGTRIVTVAYERTSDIVVAGFDPEKPDPLVPRTILRNQSFAYCAPSPDGAWLACQTIGAQEDLVLVQSDGRETRKLTDDKFKDRGAGWSPDGRTIGFFSTRSGAWESWSIRSDGSDVRQLTQFDKDGGTVIWGPDGKSGLVSASDGIWRIDTSRTNSPATSELMKELVAANVGMATSWSPDGALIAVGVRAGEGDGRMVPGVWDLARGALRVLDVPASIGVGMTFLPDSRRLIVSRPGELRLFDVRNGAMKVLQKAGSDDPSRADSYKVSADGRTLVVNRPIYDGDIWLMQTVK